MHDYIGLNNITGVLYPIGNLRTAAATRPTRGALKEVPISISRRGRQLP